MEKPITLEKTEKRTVVDSIVDANPPIDTRKPISIINSDALCHLPLSIINFESTDTI